MNSMRRRKKNWIPQTPLWHNDRCSGKSQGSSAKRSEVKVENISIADRTENGWGTERLSRTRAGELIKKPKQNSKIRRKGQPPSGATRVPVSVLLTTPLGGTGEELVQATMLFHNLMSPMTKSH